MSIIDTLKNFFDGRRDAPNMANGWAAATAPSGKDVIEGVLNSTASGIETATSAANTAMNWPYQQVNRGASTFFQIAQPTAPWRDRKSVV